MTANGNIVYSTHKNIAFFSIWYIEVVDSVNLDFFVSFFYRFILLLFGKGEKTCRQKSTLLLEHESAVFCNTPPHTHTHTHAHTHTRTHIFFNHDASK